MSYYLYMLILYIYYKHKIITGNIIFSTSANYQIGYELHSNQHKQGQNTVYNMIELGL